MSAGFLSGVVGLGLGVGWGHRGLASSAIGLEDGADSSGVSVLNLHCGNFRLLGVICGFIYY